MGLRVGPLAVSALVVSFGMHMQSPLASASTTRERSTSSGKLSCTQKCSIPCKAGFISVM